MEKTLDDEDVESLQKRLVLALEKRDRALNTGMGNVGLIEKMIHNIEDALMKKELNALRREVQRLRYENRVRTEEDEDVIVLTQERNQIAHLLKENDALRQRVAELENLVPKQTPRFKDTTEEVLEKKLEEQWDIIRKYGPEQDNEKLNRLDKKMIEKKLQDATKEIRRLKQQLEKIRDSKKRRVESCIVCADTAAYAATVYYCGPECRDQHCTK